MRRSTYLLIVLPILAFWVTATLAQGEPVQIPPEEAAKHLVKRVEPVIPALAKVMKVGGTVAAEIIVGESGVVESVNVLSGSPILRQSAIDAIKQWRYEPFHEDGHAVRVKTRVELFFPGEMPQEEKNARRAYFPVEEQCRELVYSRRYAQAENTCRTAVDLSEKLPAEATLERSIAYTFLGHSLLYQSKIQEAIGPYTQALTLRERRLKPNDADLASSYANLARAYSAANDLGKADSLYARAVETYEAAILHLPSFRENYARRLKNTLIEYAKLKRARGEEETAQTLERKAATL